ncbi:ABC transporter permease [Paucibacter sp. B2R-40]|uniref:FtsX-like permease family protein n=1 Tax=Paucibacter sp. B2R-40 TaxID=2893554 RepID=UPI0021E3A14B|nr:FtsX-like permease family protein [Paucibacter sp. B2R-40]MCV2353178.1 ABC transporter permease [Paucibacter sp. B2R-40]
MLKDLRVGWRQLIADPGYAAVILLGLSVAIACCYLVAQIVFNQVRPDPDIPEPSKVVILEFRGNRPGAQDDWGDRAPFIFGTTLRQAGAPVSAITRLIDGTSNARVEGRSVPLDIMFADLDAIAVFGLRASAGDLSEALRRPDALALTEAAANRLFPAGDALGKAVNVRGHLLTIVALMAHSPRTVMDRPGEAWANFDSPATAADPRLLDAWNAMQGKVVARVANGHAPAEVGAAAQALFDNGPGASGTPADWTANGRKGAFLRAMPLTRQYLEGGGGQAHLTLVMGLGASAALVLGLAAANYVNLTSVRTLARVREIAVRKSLGASPWRLTAQFVFESTLAALLASAVGLLLAWWFAPALGELLNLELADGLFSPGRIALLVAAAVALGVATGLYPARIALVVHCVEALAGRPHDEGAVGRNLRRVMTTLQFVVTVVIGTGACVVLWQNRHVATLAHGIRTEGLLTIDMPDGFSGKSDAVNAAFRNALSHEPGVDGLAWSFDVPGRDSAVMTETLAQGRSAPLVEVNLMRVDKDFFDVYAIPMVAGRAPVVASAASVPNRAGELKAEQAVVLDAQASRALGFASPLAAVGELVLGGGDFMTLGKDPLRIVAVAADIRLENARAASRPHVFLLGDQPQPTLTLHGTSLVALQQAIARVWPHYFPDNSAKPVTVKQAFDQPYDFERRVAQMAAGVSLLALLLSAFGVYALAAYTVRRRTREIVVRKLYGAGPARIAGLLAREFVPLLTASALIGLPLGGWLAQSWLANFTERSPTAFWALPLVMVGLVVMTALSALRHAIVAMKIRPALVLRE